jgi:hypothetical protein
MFCVVGCFNFWWSKGEKKNDFGCFDFGVVKRGKDVVGFLLCFGFALMGYCHLSMLYCRLKT